MAKNRWLDVQIRQNIEARHEQLVAVHTRLQNRQGLQNRQSFLKHTHTHTHPFNGPLSGTTRVSRYQKGKNQSGFY